MVHYYFSKLTFRQIMKELQDGTQNRYSDLRLNELLRRSIMEMNKQHLQMIQRENKSLIYIKVQTSPPTALKLVVEHEASLSARSSLPIPEIALGKLLVTVCVDSQGEAYVYACPNAVRFIPRVQRVEVGGGEGIVRISIFEVYRGRVVPSQRLCYNYQLWKDGKCWKEQKDNTFYLGSKGREGLYKCVVEVLDDNYCQTGQEIESPTVFI